ELWSTNRDDEGPLLRGGMLAQAVEWLAKRRDDLSRSERDYVEASIALSRRLELEKEAARQAEIERQRELAEAATKLAHEQRRRTRVAFGFGAIAAVAAVAAVLFALKANSESRRAETEAQRAKEQAQEAETQAEVAREKTILAQRNRALMMAGLSMRETDAGRPERGLLLALAVDPQRVSRKNLDLIKREDVPSLTAALERAIYAGVDV